MKRTNHKTAPVLLVALIAASLAGCGASSAAMASNESAVSETATVSEKSMAEVSSASAAIVTGLNLSNSGVIDTTDLFTERDLTQTVDLADATYVSLQSGEDVSITKEGVYVLSGEVTDVTVAVEVDSSEKVQLVLDGVTITNEDSPAIYVKSADKVFVTTTQDSLNTLSVTGDFTADGDTNTDAVIFSKDVLVLNGLGTLIINSSNNSISSKDDLKITGGTYYVTSTADAIEANDSILIADGSIAISSSKDGLHAENDEDDTQGYVFICGGSMSIDAASDGIQATTYLQVDDGTLDITASEGLEATYVQVNGGTINVGASDDGINATTKSYSVGTPTIEITGGDVTITMGAGDTDALDANGNLYISGGTVSISAQSAFDFDGVGELTGGTVYVNGEQVSTITNSMMGGMGNPMGGMGGPMGDMQG
ncbi:MAG: carbohydrate-binding domain-containing protein [Coriobacteriales bacterium]|nr:carbohydrate-binding domain-containing protein [Coriobacteriales bacterium]